MSISFVSCNVQYMYALYIDMIEWYIFHAIMHFSFNGTVYTFLCVFNINARNQYLFNNKQLPILRYITDFVSCKHAIEMLSLYVKVCILIQLTLIFFVALYVAFIAYDRHYLRNMAIVGKLTPMFFKLVSYSQFIKDYKWR